MSNPNVDGNDMSDQERLDKLEGAKRLIREVEFSYKYGDDMRLRLFAVVADTFGIGGSLSVVMTRLKIDILAARRNQNKD